MRIHYNRRPRTGVMLAYPFEEKRLAKWSLPWLVQPKYNGIRALAYHLPNGVILESSTGLLIQTVPHINAALQNLPLGIYDGELYLHGEFQRLTSIVLRGDLHSAYQDVQYVIFDRKDPNEQEIRLLSLPLIHPYLEGPLDLAPSWACVALDEVGFLLEEHMAKGYEGLILREAKALYKEKRTTTMMKLKPRSLDTYRIIGYLEEYNIRGEPKNRLGALLVADEDGRQFKVGSGFTAAQRETYWKQREELPGLSVLVKYQALTDRGVPWFPVFVEVVR